jgi:hypothetical protein
MYITRHLSHYVPSRPLMTSPFSLDQLAQLQATVGDRSVAPFTVAMLQNIITQLLALIEQQAAVLNQQTLRMNELSKSHGVNTLLIGTARALLTCHENDRRTIAELHALLNEENSEADDDRQSVMELAELRRWKRTFCEGETRSMAAQLEQGWSEQVRLKAEVESLRALLAARK